MCSISRIAGRIAIIAILAAGCAPHTEIVNLYDNPARISKAYKKLLVVNISSDPDQQRQFENEIVRKLRQDKVDAIPVHALLDFRRDLLQDEINQLSDEIGADGILIAHIVSVDSKAEIVAGREEIQSECRGGDPVDYFLYDHKVLSEPDSVRLAHTVAVVTNFYDAGSRSLLWSIQSTCFKKADLYTVLQEEASAIVRQLRIDHVIGGTVEAFWPDAHLVQKNEVENDKGKSADRRNDERVATGAR